jgi:hypothetical protein
MRQRGFFNSPNPYRHYSRKGGFPTMKRIAAVFLNFTTLLILAIVTVLFSGPAQAYVYDDFTNSGINASLWDDRGPNTGLFSQSGNGYLKFTDLNGGQIDGLRSHNPVSGAFFVSMQYSDFTATNNTTAMGEASGMQLRLGLSDYVLVEEVKNHYGLSFNAISFIGGTRTALKAAYPGPFNSGRLGIYYNGVHGAGGEVDFYYDYGVGWLLLDSCALNISADPYFLIRGVDTYGSSLSFLVDNVQLTPIPLPTSALLMGSGLLGLAGWRRFRKG